MLWSERKRLREIQEREAAGESLWTGEIDEAARRKIAHIWGLLLEHSTRGVEERFRRLLNFHFMSAGARAYADSPAAFVQLTDADAVLDHLEAVSDAIHEAGINTAGLFDGVVNKAFNEHRIAYQLVDRKVVPLSSDELHVEVVEPTLRLLVDARFGSAHDAYLKALKEIQVGDAGDAITDAATALQETLIALGCRGNALGPLLADAKKRGILSAHDDLLTAGVGKFIDWVSADRSTTGDAHHHPDATLDDAWLMVHVVGALVVRLAAPSAPRSRLGP